MRTRNVIIGAGSVGGIGEAIADALVRSMSRGMPRRDVVPVHPRQLLDIPRGDGRPPGTRDWEFRKRKGARPS